MTRRRMRGKKKRRRRRRRRRKTERENTVLEILLGLFTDQITTGQLQIYKFLNFINNFIYN
jgi:hypothetical protein